MYKLRIIRWDTINSIDDNHSQYYNHSYKCLSLVEVNLYNEKLMNTFEIMKAFTLIC
jgi:hypothetical protein